MLAEDRQLLHSTLSRSNLMEIKQHWGQSANDFEFQTIREPQVGMVMAVGRIEATGEPFNIGEISITRCAVRLESGEVGVGYVMGSDKEHALHIALIDALAQTPAYKESLENTVIRPLHQKILQQLAQQYAEAEETKVDFFTMVRGED